MKHLLLLLFFAALALSGCAGKPRSASYTGLKSSIGSAESAASRTDKHLSEIKGGTSTIDYKTSRALQFFN